MNKGIYILKVLAVLFIVSYFSSLYLVEDIGEKIAVIPIKGVIMSEEGFDFLRGESASSTKIVENLENAEKRKDVKATEEFHAVRGRSGTQDRQRESQVQSSGSDL
jgi:hypothetical protein